MTVEVPSSITNVTFDELEIGQRAMLTHVLTQRDIELFAVMSGDVNPMHVDEEFAHSDLFHRVIAHGMWGGALISTVLGTQLPGPGTIYLGQSLRFRHPIYVGDTVLVVVEVTDKREDHRATLDCRVTNQRGEVVITGTTDVVAPTEKVSRPRAVLPRVELVEAGRLRRRLAALTADLPPLRTAVIHPVDPASLLGAIEAARQGLIVPVLVGPRARILAAAERASSDRASSDRASSDRASVGEDGIDLSGIEIVEAEHSQAAAEAGVELARRGDVHILIAGALPGREVARPVLSAARGLRTERRLSHVSVVDAPRYSRPLLVTDTAANISPSLDDKRDIVRNAITLARALGIEVPKVALLAAVETIDPALPSTLHAAALCKMADRGQITGAVLDGPLAFDTAVRADSARADGPSSPVAGQADILLVPDLEAGTILVQQLTCLSGAETAGLVLGARVPIVLPSRSDPLSGRLASIALARILHHRPAADTRE